MFEMTLYMTDTWWWHEVPYTLDMCSITRKCINTISSSIERIPTCIEYLLMCRYRTTLPIPATIRPILTSCDNLLTGHPHAICVDLGYVMPVLLQNRLPERQTPLRVTAGHHANRVRQNHHAERKRFWQLDSLRYSRNYGYWALRQRRNVPRGITLMVYIMYPFNRLFKPSYPRTQYIWDKSKPNQPHYSTSVPHTKPHRRYTR